MHKYQLLIQDSTYTLSVGLNVSWIDIAELSDDLWLENLFEPFYLNFILINFLLTITYHMKVRTICKIQHIRDLLKSPVKSKPCYHWSRLQQERFNKKSIVDCYALKTQTQQSWVLNEHSDKFHKSKPLDCKSILRMNKNNV